jgi:glycosyltransferase 2 family protein
MSGPTWREATWVRVSWVLGIAALVVLLVVTTRFGSARDFARLLRTMRLPWMVVAVGLQLCTYACDASIWRVVLARAGSPQPFGRMFYLSIARLFAGQAVPSGGVAGHLLVVSALARYGVPIDASMSALVINLFAFYTAFILCAATSGLVFYGVAAVRGPAAAIAIPFTVFVTAIPALIAWLVRSGHALERSRLRRVPLLGRLVTTLGRARPELLRDRRLAVRATVLEVATFVCDAATLAVVLAALGHPIPIAPVFATFVLAAAAELVGPLPGGLGAFEGGCVLGLRTFGVPVEVALLATLTLRGFTFWLPMIPGALVASASTRAQRRGAHRTPDAR